MPITSLLIRLTLPCLLIMLILSCSSSTPDENEQPGSIHIGTNLEMTGSYSYAGDASEKTINLFKESRSSSVGITGDETHSIELAFRDNEGTASGAEDAVTDLINNEDVHLLIGPNVSGIAIPSGEIANQAETVMISPWSSNPLTTEGRAWVYRTAFVDTDQSPIMVNFATDHLNASTACLLFDSQPDAFSSGFAATFKSDWEAAHGSGSVAAYEGYEQQDTDVSEQLSVIANAGCDFLVIPEYSHNVPGIVRQVQEAEITIPVVGPDSWVDGDLVESCGSDCEGYYFMKHFVASGATGDAKAFVDLYTAEYGEEPGDIAALTWDAMLLAETAINNCGRITGDLAADRQCIQDGMQAINTFEGVIGSYTYSSNNNPEKCIPVVQIQESELVFVESICP